MFGSEEPDLQPTGDNYRWIETKDYCNTDLGIFWGKVTEEEKRFVEDLKKRPIDSNHEINHSFATNEGIASAIGSVEDQLEEKTTESTLESMDSPKRQSNEDINSDSVHNKNFKSINHVIEDNHIIDSIESGLKSELLDANNNQNEDIPLQNQPNDYKVIDLNPITEQLKNRIDSNADKIDAIKRYKEVTQTSHQMIDLTEAQTSITSVDSKQMTDENIHSNQEIIEKTYVLTNQLATNPLIQSPVNPNEIIRPEDISRTAIEAQHQNYSTDAEEDLKIDTELIVFDSRDDESDSSDTEGYGRQEEGEGKEGLTVIKSSMVVIKESLDLNPNPNIPQTNPTKGQNKEPSFAVSSQSSSHSDSLDAIKAEAIWTNSQEANFQEFVKRYLDDPGFNPISSTPEEQPLSHEADLFPEFP